MFILAAQGALADGAVDLWQSFRNLHPFHIQTLALSEPDAQGQRVLVISEAPPSFYRDKPEAALKDIFGARLAAVKTERHVMGADGFTEDFVVTLTPAGGDLGLDSLADSLGVLAWQLYGTTYGANVAPLLAPAGDMHEGMPPNISVTPAELNSWLIEQPAQLAGDDGTSATLAERFAANASGVFASDGIEVLLLDRKADLAGQGAALRRFEIDADLIVGAIADNADHLAIVGRQRTTSLTVLPPLRTETILLVASASGEAELAQSYERNRVFAGKLPTGPQAGKDWAPILLSDQLVDTEFGSLLNLTDQLLKSWSQAGTVNYENFDYPKPTGYPFGELALSEKLQSPETLFNWNTSGFGSVFQFGDYGIYAVARTGSLPITYGSDVFGEGMQTGQLKAEEETAWDYFSNQRDPNLVRVVQYSALYQIFHSFPVAVGRQAVMGDRKAVDASIEAALRQAVDDIIDGTAKVAPAVRDRELALLVESDDSQVADMSMFVDAMLQAQIEIAAEDLARAEDLFPDGIVDATVRYLADPRHNFPSEADRAAFTRLIEDGTTPDELFDVVEALSMAKRAAIAGSFAAFLAENDVRPALEVSADITKVFEASLAAAKSSPQTGAIRTASVVLSKGDAEAVGGHNLDAPREMVVLDPAVAPGNYAVREGGDTTTIAINPADRAKADDLPRIYERTLDDPAQQASQIKAALVAPTEIRSAEVALALPSTQARLNPKTEGLFAKGLGAAEPVDFPPAHLARLEDISASKKSDVIVEFDADGGAVICKCDPPSKIVEATNGPAVVEALKSVLDAKAAQGGGRDFIILEGSEGQVQALRASLAAQGGGKGPPRTPTGITLAAAPEPQRGNYFLFEARREANSADTIELSVRVERGLFDRIGAFFKSRPDWSQAKIHPVELQEGTAADGSAQFTIIHKIELPPPPNTLKALLLKFITHLDSKPTDAKVGADAAIVQAAVAEAARDKLELGAAIATLRQRLGQPVGVEIADIGDIYVAEADGP